MKKKYNEIRLDEDGELDDIVIACDSIHLEKMSDEGFWWLGVYKGNKRTTFHLLNKKGDIKAYTIENDLESKVLPYEK